jgi:serine/threonine protein kinase
VPRFDVLGELGRGGVGQVVAATDRDIGRRVAIKRILAEHQRSSSVMLRFVQEVRTAGQLDHPNIVTIHDVGRQPDGELFFVMKLLDGETLDALLGRLRAGDPTAHARWSFARRTELFVQVLHAMRLAHERGIVHRDLKPSNIMVGHHGEVSVVDWGLAKRVGQPDVPMEPTTASADDASVVTTRVGSLVGTPRYMAPEQARGEPADPRTDTWQLSLVFYELLTLRHPMDGVEGLTEMLDAVQHRPIPHPRHMPHPAQGPVPADLAWYVVDGLKRPRDERYADAGAMLHRLQRRADGEIPVQCVMTAQKQMLNRSQTLVDRHPFVATALATGWMAVTLGALALGFGGLFVGAVLALAG